MQNQFDENSSIRRRNYKSYIQSKDRLERPQTQQMSPINNHEILVKGSYANENVDGRYIRSNNDLYMQ